MRLHGLMLVVGLAGCARPADLPVTIVRAASWKDIARLHRKLAGTETRLAELARPGC